MDKITAPHGEKMIQIKVAFFTDDLAGDGEQYAKHAWAAGTVVIKKNKSHGIDGGQPVTMFHSMAELPFAIETELAKHGVKLHASHLSKVTPEASVTRKARAALVARKRANADA